MGFSPTVGINGYLGFVDFWYFCHFSIKVMNISTTMSFLSHLK